MIEIEHLDYHEDKVINGVLHYRDGASWTEYSKRELTEMYLYEQETVDAILDRQLDEQKDFKKMLEQDCQ